MIARIALGGLAWLTLAYLAFPLVVILGASLTTTEFLAFPPRGLTLAWYGRVVADPSYVGAFWPPPARSCSGFPPRWRSPATTSRARPRSPRF